MIGIKYVFKYLKPYYGSMAFGLFVKFIGSVMDLMLPWIMAYVIDDVVPTGDTKMIYLCGGAMLLCAVVAIIGNVVANRTAALTSSKMTRRLRFELFSKITRLSARQMDEFTVPSLESRLTSDTYIVHQMTGMMQRMGVRAPILLIGGITLTAMMDPVLTLVLVAVLPLITVVVYTVSKKGIPLYTEVQRRVDSMVRVVRENAQGIRIIRALSTGEHERKRFAAVNDNVVAGETKAELTMAVTNPAMNLFLNLGLVGVIIVGAFRVNSGLTEPGKIIAFMTYFTIILNAMLAVTRIFVNLSRGIASSGRIAEVLDAPVDETETVSDKPYPAGDSSLAVEFDHVTFSYNNKRPNLKDVSFKLKKGGTLGIIGATGSGKSTLIQLLMRFYDVNSGAVRVDGADIRTIDPETHRRRFGVALQNDFLYMDSIEENIRFGRDVDERGIEAAAAAAQADFIERDYDDGFLHPLDIKGSNLSGGQRQRMLVARALAGKPEFLILDDSSSALDYKTDANLRAAVKDLDCTQIIVAQRVSSVRHADLILVLDDGEVIASGDHDELMKSCPVYSEIFESQMGGAILD